jgi:hypothetical protein
LGSLTISMNVSVDNLDSGNQRNPLLVCCSPFLAFHSQIR